MQTLDRTAQWQHPGTVRFAAVAGLMAVASLLAGGTAVLAESPRSAAESGVWIDHKGKGAVEIVPCGTRLCGYIAWIKEPLTKAGQPLTDKYNPEPRKRGRPICGLQVLGNLKRVRDGGWEAGWVYDPNEGKTYDVDISLAGRDRLTVTGYLGTRFFSEAYTWTRAPADHVRCAPSKTGDMAAAKPPVPAAAVKQKTPAAEAVATARARVGSESGTGESVPEPSSAGTATGAEAKDDIIVPPAPVPAKRPAFVRPSGEAPSPAGWRSPEKDDVTVADPALRAEEPEPRL